MLNFMSGRPSVAKAASTMLAAVGAPPVELKGSAFAPLTDQPIPGNGEPCVQIIRLGSCWVQSRCACSSGRWFACLTAPVGGLKVRWLPASGLTLLYISAEVMFR